VRDLARARQPPYDPALTLHVAATLTALGVPSEQGLHVMEHMIQAGRGPEDLLDLPNEVEVGMARGATPTQAAEEIDREEGAQGPDGRSPHDRPANQTNPHKP
jgi:hypothetical protein